ncbi:DHH family phosphoesterase [Granulicoccus phenolivorans]|uniref:DHH family phosphoesterase n=1 Tax=Granulicoccus phenolivorans TaxID=266854 RepID=UPI00040AA67F|nr:DHH family phosphoesterase [Granulicoccus phenolivorans]
MPTLAPVADPAISPDLARDRAGTDLFALLCARRGWTAEYLTGIECADHAELLGIPEIVAALHAAYLAGDPVTIAPDFDMDGISAGVLGYAGLSELGFAVQLHVPDYERGHDLTPADVAEIAARWPQTRVLLTCDSAVNSRAGVAAAREHGWRTLVTDHHQELAPGSGADITVDPMRLDETYALTGICGAHVLYQVLAAYARAHRPDKLWEIGLLRLFAGLGTVSDAMPLVRENRQLVRDSLSLARLLYSPAPRTVPNRWGGLDPDPDRIDVDRAALLQLLARGEHHPVFVRAFRGFALVLKAFAQDGRLRDPDGLDEGFYGFYVAPALNSPRRTGAPLAPCFGVFTAADPDEGLRLMHAVIANNELRKDLTEHHLAELTAPTDTGGADPQPLAPWVYFSAARPGMYGLLANQLMHRHGHPVVVLNRPTRPDEPLAGSGRSPEGLGLIETLEPHPGLQGIGHQQACGIRVDRADRLDTLVTVLRTQTARALPDPDPGARRGDLVLGAGGDCDAPLTDAAGLFELARRTARLAPFGKGFPEPVHEIVLDPVGLRVERIGSDAGCTHAQTPEHGHTDARGRWICHRCKRHLRLRTRDGLALLWWNAADAHHDPLCRAADPASGPPESAATAGRPGAATPARLRVLARLQLSAFRGEERVQLVIQERLA